MSVYYIGSADLMPRNLDRRVEAVVPIEDPALQESIDDILQVVRSDDRLAWAQRDDGWTKVPTSVGAGNEAHRQLQERALKRAEVGMR